MRIPVPQIQRTVAPDVSGAGPQLREPAGNGAMSLAQGLQDVANMRERNAAIEQENFQRLEYEQKKARVTERFRDDRLKWTQDLERRRNEAAPGADGFTPKTLKDFDTYEETALKTVADEDERKLYKGMLGTLREHVGENAIAFESSSRRSFRLQSLTTGVDKSARTVAIDPGQFRDVLAHELATINASSDLPATEKAKLIEKARDLLSFNAAQTMVGRDPAGFLRAMATPESAAAHPVIPHIPPERLNALRNHAQSLIDQAAARAEHSTDKALKEAERTVDELRNFWISGGAPDLDYIASVQEKTRGTPFEQAANTMLEQAQKGAGHGASTIPRQEASIRAMEAALARGSNPEAEKLLSYARQVTDRQKAEYKENPWAAAARFARLPSVPDTPLANAEQAAQYVAQALPLMADIEAAAGMAVSPFQPAQAQKLAQDLHALPVGARATILGQTGEQLSIPRIAALADQLDKGNRPLSLALKLGAGRTTLDRAVQETMLRGADAIKDKTVKRDDSVLTGWRSEISQMVRGTLGDAQAEQDVIDAAYYVRAGMDEPGYPGDVKTIESAVKLVIGQPLERGGVRTILPRGMDEDAFTDKLREYTPEKLKALAPTGAVYIRGQKRTLQQLSSSLPGMGLRRKGIGQYVPVSGGAVVSLDPEGQIPLVIGVQ